MNKILIALLTTAVLSLAFYGIYNHKSSNQSQIEDLRANVYTYYQVEIEWPGSVCKFKNCNKEDMKNFDGTHFNLHGVWPTGTKQDQCKYSHDCQNIPFDASQIDSDVLQDMDQYWSGLYSSSDQFRAHEWEKHGTCWNDDTQSNLRISDKQYMNDYFRMALGVLKKFEALSILSQAGFTPNDNQEYKYNDIIGVLRKQLGSGVLGVCQKIDGHFFLHSVDFCLDLNYQPSECLCKTKKTNCGENVVIGEFSMNQ